METVLVPAPPSLQDAYSNQPVPKQTSPPRRTSSGKARLLVTYTPMHMAASMDATAPCCCGYAVMAPEVGFALCVLSPGCGAFASSPVIQAE